MSVSDFERRLSALPPDFRAKVYAQIEELERFAGARKSDLDLEKYAGAMDADSAEEILKAVELDCRRVDPCEW